MILVEAPDVDKAVRRHREAAKWIAGWRAIVARARWRSLDDVRKTYPSADGVRNRYGAIVTVFNVMGGSYRLLTVLHYEAGIAYEIDFLSHGEYDRNNWKEWHI